MPIISNNAAMRPLCVLPILLMAFASEADAQKLVVLTPASDTSVEYGDLIELRWGGIPADEPVRIEISSDGSRSWRTLARHATGGSFSWTATGAPSDRIRVRISHARRDSQVVRLSHSAPLSTVRFSNDGNRVVTTALDWTIGIWDATDGRLLRSWSVETDRPPYNFYDDWRPRACFSPDGRLIAVSGIYDSLTGPVTTLFDAVTGEVRGTHRLWAPAAFSGDGSLLAGGGGVIDVASGRQVTYLLAWDLVSSIEFTSGGDSLLVAEVTGPGVSIYAVDSNSIDLLGERFPTSDGSMSGVSSASFGRDETAIVGIHDDAVAFAVDRGTRRLLWRRRLADTTAPPLATLRLDSRATRAGDAVFVGMLDGSVRLLDIGDGAPLRRMELHRGPVHALDVAPAGETFASGGDDSTVCIVRFGAGRDTSFADGEITVLPAIVEIVGDSFMGVTTTPYGNTIVRDVHVANRTRTPLTLRSIEVQSDDRFVVRGTDRLPSTIAPGDSFSIDLEFYPRALGEFSATMVASFAEGATASKVFSARVVPQPILARALELGFVDSAAVFDTLIVDVVRNVDTIPWTVTLRKRDWDPPTDTTTFTILEGEGTTTLEPGQGWNMLIRVAPKERLHRLWSMLECEYDGPGSPMFLGISASSNNDPILAAAPPTVSVQSAPALAFDGVAVTFILRSQEQARLVVVDLLGRQVATLAEGRLGPGAHRITVDRSIMPDGFSLVSLEAHGRRWTIPVMWSR